MKMKARLLISNAAYGPEALKQLFQAFDDAWDIIAPTVGDDPLAIEASRIRLANIILGLANNGSTDPDHLTHAAVSLMPNPEQKSP